jgi:hypothetical protein
VEFSSHHHFYKLSCSWLLGVCHRFCHLQLACEGFPSPPCLALRTSHPLCYLSFCCYCLLFRFFFFFWFFSPGWGSVNPGQTWADLAQGCLWEYHIPLSSLCGLHLPKPSGCCRLAAAQEPSWFLCLM